MGLFDTVVTECKNCGSRIEFQSKVGFCRLDQYTIDSVPVDVAKDINGDTETCDDCQCENKIVLRQYIPENVNMEVQ